MTDIENNTNSDYRLVSLFVVPMVINVEDKFINRVIKMFASVAHDQKAPETELEEMKLSPDFIKLFNWWICKWQPFARFYSTNEL